MGSKAEVLHEGRVVGSVEWRKETATVMKAITHDVHGRYIEGIDLGWLEQQAA